MNKSNIGTVYVPPKDHKVWDESDTIARALGMSRSELIVQLLRKVCNVDSKAEVSIAHESLAVQERARKVLFELLDSKPAAEGQADATDVDRVGV